MGPEQDGPTPEESAKFKAKGREQLVTNDLENYGRTENTGVIQAHASEENARFDALEKAKAGDLSGLSSLEQERLLKVASEEGRESAKSFAEGLQDDITKNGFDFQEVSELAGDMAYSEFGPKGSAEKNSAADGIKSGMVEVLSQKNKMDQADRRQQGNKPTQEGGQ